MSILPKELKHNDPPWRASNLARRRFRSIMMRGMKLPARIAVLLVAAVAALTFVAFGTPHAAAQSLAKHLIDWDATDKYEQGRLQGAPSPEAVQLDKELEAEQKAEEARSPHVAPGLRLPEEGGVFLLDTFQNQPQLDELQQSGGELNKNTKSNILRAAINPLASSKQTIELDGARAKIQSHTGVPAIYVNIDSQDAAGGATGAKGEPPPLPSAE